MIDTEQLIKLGWSQELIDEVTRVSGYIEGSFVREISFEETRLSLISESSNSINFTYSDTSTDSDLSFE